MDDFQDMLPSKASNNNLKASQVTFVQIYASACNQRNIQCSILSIFKKVISLQLKDTIENHIKKKIQDFLNIYVHIFFMINVLL